MYVSGKPLWLPEYDWSSRSMVYVCQWKAIGINRIWLKFKINGLSHSLFTCDYFKTPQTIYTLATLLIINLKSVCLWCLISNGWAHVPVKPLVCLSVHFLESSVSKSWEIHLLHTFTQCLENSHCYSYRHTTSRLW